MWTPSKALPSTFRPSAVVPIRFPLTALPDEPAASTTPSSLAEITFADPDPVPPTVLPLP